MSSQRRSRSRSSSSDDEKKKPKAPPGPPSLHYQIAYQQSSLVVTVIECKVIWKSKKSKIKLIGNVRTWRKLTLLAERQMELLRFIFYQETTNQRKLKLSKIVWIMFLMKTSGSRYFPSYFPEWFMLYLWNQVPYNDVGTKTLIFQVFDWDRFSKNDPIGEIKIQLGQLDISKPLQEWRVLQAITGKVRILGFQI